jgi:hypothetical protein
MSRASVAGRAFWNEVQTGWSTAMAMPGIVIRISLAM